MDMFIFIMSGRTSRLVYSMTPPLNTEVRSNTRRGEAALTDKSFASN